MPRTQNPGSPHPGFPDPTPTNSEIPWEFPIWFQKKSLENSLEVQDPRAHGPGPSGPMGPYGTFQIHLSSQNVYVNDLGMTGPIFRVPGQN